MIVVYKPHITVSADSFFLPEIKNDQKVFFYFILGFGAKVNIKKHFNPHFNYWEIQKGG